MIAVIDMRLGWQLWVAHEGSPWLHRVGSGRAPLFSLHSQPRTLALLAAKVEHQKRKQLIAAKAGDKTLARMQLMAQLDLVAEQIREMREDLATGADREAFA